MIFNLENFCDYLKTLTEFTNIFWQNIFIEEPVKTLDTPYLVLNCNKWFDNQWWHFNDRIILIVFTMILPSSYVLQEALEFDEIFQKKLIIDNCSKIKYWNLDVYNIYTWSNSNIRDNEKIIYERDFYFKYNITTNF